MDLGNTEKKKIFITANHLTKKLTNNIILKKGILNNKTIKTYWFEIHENVICTQKLKDKVEDI